MAIYKLLIASLMTLPPRFIEVSYGLAIRLPDTRNLTPILCTTK